jgi:hypothetical protein
MLFLLLHPELIDYPAFWILALVFLLIGAALLIGVIMLIRKFFFTKKSS